jgi:hypothetical protein
VHIGSEKLPENSIVVEDTLTGVHPLVAKTQEDLANTKVDNSGLLAGRDHGCLDIKVAKDSLDRAFRIMNALLKALDRRGFTVSVDQEKRTTKAKALDETVTFSLEEILDRSERPLTPAQEKDKDCKLEAFLLLYRLSCSIISILQRICTRSYC